MPDLQHTDPSVQIEKHAAATDFCRRFLLPTEQTAANRMCGLHRFLADHTPKATTQGGGSSYFDAIDAIDSGNVNELQCDDLSPLWIENTVCGRVRNDPQKSPRRLVDARMNSEHGSALMIP